MECSLKINCGKHHSLLENVIIIDNWGENLAFLELVVITFSYVSLTWPRHLNHNCCNIVTTNVCIFLLQMQYFPVFQVLQLTIELSSLICSIAFGNRIAQALVDERKSHN